MPIDLHTVTERHPQLGLLLRGHALPTLLDIGESSARDSTIRGSTSLLKAPRENWTCANGAQITRSTSEGAKKTSCGSYEAALRLMKRL